MFIDLHDNFSPTPFAGARRNSNCTLQDTFRSCERRHSEKDIVLLLISHPCGVKSRDAFQWTVATLTLASLEFWRSD